VASEGALSKNAPLCASSAPSPAKARWRMAWRISFPSPCPWWARPNHEPVVTERRGEVLRLHVLHADHLAVHEDRSGVRPLLRRPLGPLAPPPLRGLALALGRGRSVKGVRNGMVAGSWIPVLDHGQQRAELLFTGQPDLEARRADDEVEEGPELRPWPTLTHPPGW
jgi:hypothetical protein